MSEITIKHTNETPLSAVVITICIYIFLSIERPWESIRYLQGIPIERVYAIAMIVIAVMCGRFKIVKSPLNKWVYGLLALHFILAPFAFNTSDSIDQGIEYAKVVIIYLLILSASDDENTLKSLIKAYVFTMIFYSLHSLWEYNNGRFIYRMGISRMVGVDSTFSDPNSFGGSIVLSLPFVYALLRNEVNTWLRRLYYFYYIIAVICIILTGSRSAFVAFMILLFLWIFTQKGMLKFKFFFAGLPIVLLIWTIIPEQKQNRIRTLWDEDAGPASAQVSADGRLDGFKVSWKMFKQVPFTGVGAGGKNFIGYRLAHHIDEDGHASPTQAHNLYGEVLAEFGVLGVCLLGGLVVTILRCSLIVRRELDALGAVESFSYYLTGAILTVLFLLLFLGLGGHNFYRPMWLWLAAWAGALFNISIHVKNHQKLTA